MTGKAKGITIAMAIVLAVGSSMAWLTVSNQAALDRTVLDGKPIGYWLDNMARDANDDRDEIRDRLIALGEPVIPPLLAALEDRPPALKKKITTPFLLNHFPKFAEWLWRRRPASSWMAAYTLAKMPPDPRIRDALIRAVRRAKDPQEDSNIGFYAVQALGTRYTNESKRVLPALVGALGVPHDNIQAAAARAMPAFGTNGLVALPTLISFLEGTNNYLIAHSAQALGKFGPAAAIARSGLRPLLTNETPHVRRSAAVALWRITPGSVFPTDVLLGCMTSDSTQERILAAEELVRLNPAASDFAVLTYVKVLNAPSDITFGQTNHWYRCRAAPNLGELGAVAQSALPALANAEESDENLEVRQAAKSARQKIEKALRERDINPSRNPTP